MRRTPVSFSMPVLPVSTKERTATAAKIHCYVENRVKLRVMDGRRTVENENRWGLRAGKTSMLSLERQNKYFDLTNSLGDFEQF